MTTEPSQPSDPKRSENANRCSSGVSFPFSERDEGECGAFRAYFVSWPWNRSRSRPLELLQHENARPAGGHQWRMRTELVPGSQPARYRLDEAHVPADAVLALHEDALPLSQSLGTILHASAILGERRQHLAADLALWRGGVRSGDRPWDERIGKLQVDIEILAALIERAATALDLAQVNPAPAGVSDVCRLAPALEFAALSAGDRARQRSPARPTRTDTLAD